MAQSGQQGVDFFRRLTQLVDLGLIESVPHLIGSDGTGRKGSWLTHPGETIAQRQGSYSGLFGTRIGWLLRLGVRHLTGGSYVGYILSAGRADVKPLR